VASAEKSLSHRKQTAAVAEVEGLMILVALGLTGCFWLAPLIAFRKNAINQRKYLCSLSRGHLRDMRHKLLAQIGASRVALVMRACLISTVCGCIG
jgi:hypothetical protein